MYICRYLSRCCWCIDDMYVLGACTITLSEPQRILTYWHAFAGCVQSPRRNLSEFLLLDVHVLGACSHPVGTSVYILTFLQFRNQSFIILKHLQFFMLTTRWRIQVLVQRRSDSQSKRWGPQCSIWSHTPNTQKTPCKWKKLVLQGVHVPLPTLGPAS